MTLHLGTQLHEGPIDASPPPGRRDRGRDRRLSAAGLWSLSLVVVWTLLYLGFLSGFQQSHDQHRLYGELRTQLALGEVPTGSPIRPGTPIGLVSIPRAGVHDVVFVEGTRNEQLQQGPGHVAGSVLPGQQGTSLLAGKSFTFGAPFRDVPFLPPGSAITVTTVQGRFTYAVAGVRRQGDPLAAPPSGTGARLTLVTSLRSPGILGWTRHAETVYVDADLAKGAVPPGATTSQDPDLTYMKGHLDTKTLAQLALALQLLVVVLVASAWAWRRWSRSGTWVVAVPAVLAAAWLATSYASLLLPGLI